MALTRNKPRVYSNLIRRNSLQLAAATTVWEGSAVGIDASTGRVRPVVAGDLFAGFASRDATSARDVTGATPTSVLLMAEGEVLLTVSGVTATSIGASVFATDDDTFALTGSTLVGDVLRVPAAGQAVVAFQGGRARMSSAEVAAGQALVSGAWNTAGLGLVEPGNGVTPTASSAAGVTVNSSGFVTVDGEQWFRVNATATSGSNNYFEINVPTFVATGADTAVVEYQCDPSKGSPMVLYLGTASYSVFATGSRSLSAPGNNDPFQHVGRTAATIHKSLWNKNGTYTRDTIEQAWVIAKLRVTVTNGETQDFYLRSVRVGVAARKGRLCVISDDGYDSFLRLGVPILERYGIPSTMAIISDKVGVTAQGYVTLDQLRAYVAAGNACVAHGPIGGSGNLYTTYTTNAQRIADMNVHRDYLLSNGLTDARGAQCYVWPQGRYSNGSGEVSLLDDAYAAGYRLARAATAYPSKSGALPMHVFSLANVSPRSHSRLCLPIIGHDYNGATNTADDANETTNVDRIITAIGDLADSGLDAFLMLHKVVARGAATSGGIEIETDRLNAIAAAIQAQVAAGKLQAVTMPDLLPR